MVIKEFIDINRVMGAKNEAKIIAKDEVLSHTIVTRRYKMKVCRKTRRGSRRC